MTLFRVSLHVEQIISAEDREEALGIFWDDLNWRQAHEEIADVEELGQATAERR